MLHVFQKNIFVMHILLHLYTTSKNGCSFFIHKSQLTPDNEKSIAFYFQSYHPQIYSLYGWIRVAAIKLVITVDWFSAYRNRKADQNAFHIIYEPSSLTA